MPAPRPIATVLGVDPGLSHTGFAIIDVYPDHEVLRAGDVVHTTPPEDATPATKTKKKGKRAGKRYRAEDDLQRAVKIHDALAMVAENFGVTHVAIESLSLGMPNTLTMIQQGMVFAVCGLINAYNTDVLSPQEVRKLIGVVEPPRAQRNVRVKECSCGRVFGTKETACGNPRCGLKRPKGPPKPAKDPEKPEVREALEQRWGDLSALACPGHPARGVHIRDAAAVVAAALEDPRSRLRQLRLQAAA